MFSLPIKRLCAAKNVSKRRVLYSQISQCSNIVSSEINVVKSTLPDVEIPNIPLHEYIWKNVDKWHDKTALECAETGRSYTYNEAHQMSNALASFLRFRLRLKRGDTAAIVLPNVPEYPIIITGATKAGIIVTTCNPNFNADEISKQFVSSGTKLVFTLTSLWPIVNKASKMVSNANISIVVINHQVGELTPPGSIKFKEITETIHDGVFESISMDDVLLLPFSSGTTGLPKGVELTQKNVTCNISQFLAPEIRLHYNTEAGHQDVIPGILPFFHIYGLVLVLLTLISQGCKLVTIPKFGSEILLKVLKQHKPTVAHIVPPIVLMLVNNPNIQTEHLKSLRVLLSGAAPLDASDIGRFKEKTNGEVALLQAYGLTEAAPGTHMQSRVVKNGIKIGSSGLAFPNTDCKIIALDSADRTGLGPRQTGELLIRGPQIMKGYLNNPQATAEVLVDGNWLKTGDIGHYDEDNHFYITDRFKELIKVKGFQVAPAELEAILRNHPAVEDAAVTGIRDPTHGEVPKGFVVLRPGSKVSMDQLSEYVASKVSSYKQLRGGIVFLDSIPKTASGKILRRQLKDL